MPSSSSLPAGTFGDAKDIAGSSFAEIFSVTCGVPCWLLKTKVHEFSAEKAK
jgi:hypothetical protein